MPSDVSRPEEELRPIFAEERLVTPTLSLSQHIHLTLELLMRRDRTRLAQHLTPLDLLLLRTPKKSTDVVTRLPLIKQLPEHLKTRARRLLRRPDPNELALITRVDHTLIHIPDENSAPPSDSNTT